MKKATPWIAVALIGLGLVVAYASVAGRLAGKLVLPADDAYVYLSCAADHGVACARSPSVTWPGLLSLVALVVDGPALVTAAFWVCALLYAITVANVYWIANRLGGRLSGVLAAVATLAIAPFAWAALSGVEVALSAALWTTALALFTRRSEAPGFALALVVVALGLARHELVVVAVGIAIAGAWRTETTHGLAAWIAIAVPAVGWLMFFEARPEQVADLEAVRGDGAPLAYVFAGIWLVGVVRLWLRKTALAMLIVLTPIAYLLVGRVAIAAAFPVFAIAVGCAVAETTNHTWLRPRIAGGIVAVLALAGLGALPLRASIIQYAQDASDLDRRATAFKTRFADAVAIGTHDPGAVGFYSGVRTIALDGPDPLEGPGAKFERLERLAPDARPSHFISSPASLGFDELFGEARAFASPGPKLADRRPRGEMQWLEARWDHVGTAERPLTAHRGWRVVDRVDVADLDDERAHRWVAGGTQATLLHRETGAAGLLLDGGRTLAGDAQFRITVDPAKPMRLVLRTGGARAQETLTAASLVVNGHALAVPAPRGTLVEVEVEIPASSTISVEADRSYRAFHWFVLQPD